MRWNHARNKNLKIDEEVTKPYFLSEVRNHVFDKIETEALLMNSKGKLCKYVSLSWPTIENVVF